MMKNGRMFMCAALIAACGLPALWGQSPTQQAGSDAGGQFPSQLLAQLKADGWAEPDVNAFAQAAGQVDWSGTQASNAEGVALALTLQRRERLQLTATEQAQVALQLALMTAEMHAAGFDGHDTAVAAVVAARNTLGVIGAWLDGGRQGQLGDLIRNRIAQTVRTQVRMAATAQSAGRTEQAAGEPGLQGNGPPSWAPVGGGNWPPQRPGK